jgi:hypothetical protein
MKLPKNLGMLLLAIWLILSGALAIIPAVTFSGSGTVLAVLAIVVGVLLLLGK